MPLADEPADFLMAHLRLVADCSSHPFRVTTITARYMTNYATPSLKRAGQPGQALRWAALRVQPS